MTLKVALAHLVEKVEKLACPLSTSKHLGNRFRHDERMSFDGGASATRHFAMRVTNTSTRGNGRQGGRYERFMIELRIDYLDQANSAELSLVMAEDIGTVGDVLFSSTNWDQTRTGIRIVGNEAAEISTATIEQINQGARAILRFPIEVFR
jgi:hypothetical protein